MTSAQKLCFVIGPIGEQGSENRTHADWLLDGIIRPVFALHFSDFHVQRADEIKAPGDINSQIITRLMDAPLVIADMSMHNANAFYELAVRHMVRLPTIHIIHKDWKIPFDVAPYRAIHFSRQDYSDITKARAELEDVVREVIAPGFEVENPITHARARIELDNHATPAAKALAAEVAALRETIDEIQDKLSAVRTVQRRSYANRNYLEEAQNTIIGSAMAKDLSLAELGRELANAKPGGLLSELYLDAQRNKD